MTSIERKLATLLVALGLASNFGSAVEYISTLSQDCCLKLQEELQSLKLLKDSSSEDRLLMGASMYPCEKDRG